MRAVLITVFLIAACAKPETATVACASLVQGCVLEEGKVFIKTDSAPVPLQPFSLMVSAPAAQEVHVELHMQDMEMGLNRYRLIRQANGEWRAAITLPVCVSGRRDWLMVIDADGVRRTLSFQTN